MTDLRSLAAELDFPREVQEALAGVTAPLDEAIVRDLTDPATYDDATARMKAFADPDGMITLAHSLAAACLTRDHYRERGLDDKLFLATMECFPRFVGEHYVSFGTYGFDRAFWTGRQLSMLLFRIGTLEYEMVMERGEPMISMHIPSDADLTPASIDASVAAAHAFFARYYPAYTNARYMCCSWLLSPALRELLPPESRIVRFQARFTIGDTNWESESYRRWVFRDSRLSPADFPEQTSLQRAIKQHVLRGGRIGEAYGVYCKK